MRELLERRLRGTRLAEARAERAEDVPVKIARGRMLLEGPLGRDDLRRAVVLAEILAPPVSEREPT